MNFNIQRFLAVIKKEFIQVRRDPISLRLAIAMPVMMMLIFGYAVKMEVDNIPTAVFDRSKTQESRLFIEKFSVSNYFLITHYVSGTQEVNQLLDKAEVKACIIIPEDFSQNLKRNKTANVEFIVDGTEPTTATTALNSSILITAAYNGTMQEVVLKKAGATVNIPNVQINAKAWNNPNLETRKFTIPGLLGVIMQNITVLLTAFAFVREKERGTIEQLMVTPVSSAELILAKMIPFIIIGFVGFLISFGICVFWFKIGVEGSVGLLMVLGLVFVISALSIGMLISTFAQNQAQAMLGSFAILLPSIILSDFVFPVAAMPKIIATLGQILPIYYFIDIVRGIFLKGVGAEILIRDIIALLTITSILLTVASLRVRKTLD